METCIQCGGQYHRWQRLDPDWPTLFCLPCRRQLHTEAAHLAVERAISHEEAVVILAQGYLEQRDAALADEQANLRGVVLVLKQQLKQGA